VNSTQLLNSMRILARYNLPCLVHAELDDGQVTTTTIGRSYDAFLHSRPASWENDAIALVIRCMQTLRNEGLEPKAHIVHLSSAQALASIRDARHCGLQLTVETCPHYLTLHAEAIADGKPLYKCCPPIREQANQDRLWEAIRAGDIDFIVSDHSPCSPQLKALDTGDLGQAWGGIAALQFGLPLLWTEAQKRHIPLTDLVHLLSRRIAEFLDLGHIKGRIAPGLAADLCLFDDQEDYTIHTDMIAHRHKISPYVGSRVTGRVIKTWLRGQLVYDRGDFPGPPRGQILRKASPAISSTRTP